MRLVILLCGAWLALSATTASASGINLAWSKCMGEGTGTQNRVFACDTNEGASLIVGSYVSPPGGIGQLTGNEIVINLQSAGTVLPRWWGFKNTGTCRPSSLSSNFIADPANAVCLDQYAGYGAGGIGAYQIGFAGVLTNARIIMGSATPEPVAIIGNTEYFAFNLRINNVKTVGTDACAGCLTPVCIVMNQIRLNQPTGVGDYQFTTGASPGSNYVTWQGGAVGGLGCPAATPTHDSTWGMVKSLYR